MWREKSTKEVKIKDLIVKKKVYTFCFARPMYFIGGLKAYLHWQILSANSLRIMFVNSRPIRWIVYTEYTRLYSHLILYGLKNARKLINQSQYNRATPILKTRGKMGEGEIRWTDGDQRELASSIVHGLSD